MTDKEKKSSRVNLIASVVVAIITLLSLMFLQEEPAQESTNKKSKSVSAAPHPHTADSEDEVPTKAGTVEADAEVDRGLNEDVGRIPELILPPLYPEGTEPDLQLPPDLEQQMKSAVPELPDDLRQQLESPPPPLPPDLESQLNTTTPELPEDIQRALSIPPRLVTAEEVNTPP